MLNLTDEDLAQSSVLWYLVSQCGWLPSQQHTGSTLSWVGRCRWHSERSGSLTVYRDHLHCYGGGCGAHADLARLIGVEEFGLDFGDNLGYEVLLKRDQFLAAFLAQGGVLLDGPSSPGERVARSTGTQKALSVPGPLQRRILNRLTGWWHEQLLATHPGACAARSYLKTRGVADWIIKACPVLGYMPDGKELHWRQWTEFDALFRVTGEELEVERQWYRAHLPEETLTDEHLFFLRTPRAFAQRLGILTDRGAYRMANRLIFSCQNGRGETRFYQSRVLSQASQGGKFLNPPGMTKYPFVVSLAMLGQDRGQALMPGTLLTESPFGPLVALSHQLCPVAIATLGEGAPTWDHLAGLPAPIWLGQDNDEAHFLTKRGRVPVRRILFPGDEQAAVYARFFAERHKQAYRLRPWKYLKGMDEWINQNGEGIDPIVATMRQILLGQSAA